MALHVMICLHTSNSEDSLSCEFVFAEHNNSRFRSFWQYEVRILNKLV